MDLNSNSGQGLLEVSDDVVNSFDSHGESNEVVDNAQASSVVSWNRGVGHQSRARDQGLNGSQRLSQSDYLEPFKELVHLLDVSLQVEAEHARTTVQVRSSSVFQGDLVLRMRRQAWKEHLLNLGVLLEPLGHLKRILRSLLDSELEGLAASERNPSVERRHAQAFGLHLEVEVLIQLVIVESDTTSENVGVASDVLRDRVQRDVSTQLERILYDVSPSLKDTYLESWRHEGVVHDQDAALLLADFCNCRNVDALQGGVGWRLHPDDLGVLLYRGSELLHASEVSEVPRDASLRSEAASQVPLVATVQVVDAEVVVALVQQTETQRDS